MGRINQVIDNELEAKLRAAARKKFGDKKGSLKKAFEEAVQLWIETQNRLFLMIEVDEEIFNKLDNARQRKPNGELETLDDVLTRLLDSVVKVDKT